MFLIVGIGVGVGLAFLLLKGKSREFAPVQAHNEEVWEWIDRRGRLRRVTVRRRQEVV